MIAVTLAEGVHLKYEAWSALFTDVLGVITLTLLFSNDSFPEVLFSSLRVVVQVLTLSIKSLLTNQKYGCAPPFPIFTFFRFFLLRLLDGVAYLTILLPSNLIHNNDDVMIDRRERATLLWKETFCAMHLCKLRLCRRANWRIQRMESNR